MFVSSLSLLLEPILNPYSSNSKFCLFIPSLSSKSPVLFFLILTICYLHLFLLSFSLTMNTMIILLVQSLTCTSTFYATTSPFALKHQLFGTISRCLSVTHSLSLIIEGNWKCFFLNQLYVTKLYSILKLNLSRIPIY